MGYSIYYDSRRNRDLGYGVPAICDHPDCSEEIDRGLSYVCGGEPYTGGEHGCGLYFCSDHLQYHEAFDDPEDKECCCRVCERCAQIKSEFSPKPDTKYWMRWKMKHKSWKEWRDENPDEVEKIRAVLYPPKSGEVS